jgi:hypothetical protein
VATVPCTILAAAEEAAEVVQVALALTLLLVAQVAVVMVVLEFKIT